MFQQIHIPSVNHKVCNCMGTDALSSKKQHTHHDAVRLQEIIAKYE